MVIENSQVAPAAKTVSTLQSASPANVPYTESERLVIVTGSSLLVFFTVNVKVTLPPVSGTSSTLGVLVTSIVGTTFVKSTVASSVSVASVLSLSFALPVNTLV